MVSGFVSPAASPLTLVPRDDFYRKQNRSFFWIRWNLLRPNWERRAFEDGKTNKDGLGESNAIERTSCRARLQKNTARDYDESIATSGERRRWIQSRTIHVFVLFSLRFSADNRASDQESSDRETILDFPPLCSTSRRRRSSGRGPAIHQF